jgi:hypothetical protein
MAFGFDRGPDFLDVACFSDEEGTADDAHIGAAHEFFLLPGAELFDGLVMGVAEQSEVEFPLLLEGGLGLDGVGAHAEDGDAALVEIFFCVTKLGRFDGSTRGVGLGKKKEEDALAAKIGEGYVHAFIGFEAKVGSVGACF